MQFSTSVEIAAPADLIWAVMIDVARWHEWTASITSIERLDDGPFGIGSRVRIRQPGLPPAVWVVTTFAPGIGFTWVARSPGVRVTADHRIASSPTGSTATVSIHYGGPLGPLIGRITHRTNHRYLGLEAAGLKRRSEERAAQPGGVRAAG